MDFEYSPEQEAFRRRGSHLARREPTQGGLCVDDSMDERVAPNREVFENRRRQWQATMHAAGWVARSHGRANTADATRA